jgi:hypothetical protein
MRNYCHECGRNLMTAQTRGRVTDWSLWVLAANILVALSSGFWLGNDHATHLWLKGSFVLLFVWGFGWVWYCGTRQRWEDRHRRPGQ